MRLLFVFSVLALAMSCGSDNVENSFGNNATYRDGGGSSVPNQRTSAGETPNGGDWSFGENNEPGTSGGMPGGNNTTITGENTTPDPDMAICDADDFVATVGAPSSAPSGTGRVISTDALGVTFEIADERIVFHTGRDDFSRYLDPNDEVNFVTDTLYSNNLVRTHQTLESERVEIEVSRISVDDPERDFTHPVIRFPDADVVINFTGQGPKNDVRDCLDTTACADRHRVFLLGSGQVIFGESNFEFNDGGLREVEVDIVLNEGDTTQRDGWQIRLDRARFIFWYGRLVDDCMIGDHHDRSLSAIAFRER